MTTLPSENYFFTPRNRSFSCTSRQRLTLNEYNKNGSIVKDDVLHVLLDLDTMHVQAFDIPASGEFSEGGSLGYLYELCKMSDKTIALNNNG